MRSRRSIYVGKMVTVKQFGDETCFRGTVMRCFEDLGCIYMRIKIKDSTAVVDIPADSIQSIAPGTEPIARVYEFRKLRLVKP